MSEERAHEVAKPSKVATQRLRQYWTNRSVVKLAQGGDPVEAVVRAARDVVLNAMEAGWSGPPYDPIQLANYLGIAVIPRDDVADARLVPTPPAGVSIEFNSSNPPARTKFSVAHELAHTLFPDHGEKVRMRGQPQGDDWQLELLCNVAAAEFLMPIGTAGELEREAINVENLIRLRNQFGVSTEALFLRMVKLTGESCAVFSAARVSGENESPAFRIDYTVPSRYWRGSISRGFGVKRSTVLSDCTAVGYTSKGHERWSDSLPEFAVECVGIPAYPGDLYPRVIGVLRQAHELPSGPPMFTEVRGDATQPRGDGRKVIAHIVNDKTAVWGPGFPRALRAKWPDVQDDFMHWTREQKANLALGNTHVTQVSEELSIFHMIAQHGYGPSPKPRIRYVALRKCLDQLAEYALGQHATVHMPRIGTGYAGGQWSIVRELVEEALVRRGIEVTVYVLPGSDSPKEVQGVLSSRMVAS